jgi:hypothetical protein
VGLSEFEGRGGNDVITGLVNASGQVLGRVSYVSATAGVTVDLLAGTADGDASVGHDTFSLINAVVGSGYGRRHVWRQQSGRQRSSNSRAAAEMISWMAAADLTMPCTTTIPSSAPPSLSISPPE